MKRAGVRHGGLPRPCLRGAPSTAAFQRAGSCDYVPAVAVAAQQQTWHPAALDAVSRRQPALPAAGAQSSLRAPREPGPLPPPLHPAGELPRSGAHALQLLPCTLVRRRPPDGTAHGTAASYNTSLVVPQLCCSGWGLQRVPTRCRERAGRLLRAPGRGGAPAHALLHVEGAAPDGPRRTGALRPVAGAVADARKTRRWPSPSLLHAAVPGLVRRDSRPAQLGSHNGSACIWRGCASGPRSTRAAPARLGRGPAPLEGPHKM